MCRSIGQKISGVTCANTPEIFIRNSSPMRRSFRYRNKNGYFLAVTSLGGQFVAARAVKPHRTFVNNTELTSVLFVIIDDSTGQVLQDLFHWRISGNINWTFQNINFETVSSCNGQYVIVIGPAEQNCIAKTAKVITKKKSFVLWINVSINSSFYLICLIH